MSTVNLLVKPINDAARSRYANHGHFHEGDAGLDLYTLESMRVEPGETAMIKFGISCEPASGRAYFLIPRSSISKTPLRMSNSIGLIDGGYRGEIMAAVDNIKSEAFVVEAGTRLFQLVFPDCGPISYQLADELSETSRGSGGFGSTGK
ncbi:dUTP diphosphatase [Pelagicoccus sp. SDUM812003]|uniref:dUTP diphosphatase n=1 Tax=Pelagicoccus sp. SDUM812003 TaxID=3041267 RepID=UPI00280F5DEF|nr:dUTP diphosphatase [Pelagicoccus sp. SDUM812003]MDQ8204077.1 dUTP diphosphatase [Pelagicoccus sp. SDUM812003]